MLEDAVTARVSRAFPKSRKSCQLKEGCDGILEEDLKFFKNLKILLKSLYLFNFNN